MTEPRSLLVAGDLHANPKHLIYLFERALEQNVDAIFQVGDFGYFEHFEGGPEFLDLVGELATENDMPFYWIDGNHENHRMLRERYVDSERTPENFWTIRPGLFYVPRGRRWSWNGVTLMGYGGAVSIDAQWRRDIELYGGKLANGRWGPPTGRYTQWWPEEVPTEAELSIALQDKSPVDILFTHDKPRSASVGWGKPDLRQLWPVANQIQMLVDTVQPKLLVHGHLHYRYTDVIRCGHDGKRTVVEGLANDGEGSDSWVRLDLVRESASTQEK